MDKDQESTHLYDPRTSGEALRFTPLCLEGGGFEPARTNYFAVYRIASGAGTVAVDDGCHRFGPDTLLFVVPYQYLRFALDQPVTGEIIEFHANFLCVETFHAESGCSSVLFNDPYGVPLVVLNGRARIDVKGVIDRIRQEYDERAFAFQEVVLAYLIKDAIMLGAALVTMADSAKAYLRKRAIAQEKTK